MRSHGCKGHVQLMSFFPFILGEGREGGSHTLGNTDDETESERERVCIHTLAFPSPTNIRKKKSQRREVRLINLMCSCLCACVGVCVSA